MVSIKDAKTINGKKYRLDSIFTAKNPAEKRATFLRGKKFSVRIIEKGDDYYIWIRRN